MAYRHNFTFSFVAMNIISSFNNSSGKLRILVTVLSQVYGGEPLVILLESVLCPLLAGMG